MCDFSRPILCNPLYMTKNPKIGEEPKSLMVYPKNVEPGLFSKPVEFDGIKIRVVELLPGSVKPLIPV